MLGAFSGLGMFVLKAVVFIVVLFVGGFLIFNIKKWPRFLVWKGRDIKEMWINRKNPVFREFGLSIWTGRQGSGKSVSMVEYLERMKKKYPNVRIYTNFGYKNQTAPMEDWSDLFKYRNGTQGVIFAIDEIQNEFDSTKWKEFSMHEGLLSQITQQRKQRIKIVATSQVFTRVVKQLREQCFEVIECWTLLGRWTFSKCYDADDYNSVIDSNDNDKKRKLIKKWKHSFIQTNYIRDLFESYAVIEKMKNTKYVSIHDRKVS